MTDKILHAFFEIVYPRLGYGFLEKVYENAMVVALRALGATPYEEGLLLNFGPKPSFRRKAYNNERKTPTWEQQ